MSLRGELYQFVKKSLEGAHTMPEPALCWYVIGGDCGEESILRQRRSLFNTNPDHGSIHVPNMYVIESSLVGKERVDEARMDGAHCWHQLWNQGSVSI